MKTYINYTEVDEIVDDLVEELLEYNPSEEYKGCEGSRKERIGIEEKYGCKIESGVEKVNSLQYNYFYEITFNGIDDVLNIEIESGISRGTVLNHCEWEYSSKPTSRTVEVLKEVVFNNDAFLHWYNSNNKTHNKLGLARQKAKILFERHKDEILKLYKDQNYDNYVTGCSSNKIDNYYNNRKRELNDSGVFWECVYEEIEVDVNWK